MKLLIITGMSGAGKSQVANTIEDMGFYCVDNIPPAIIPSFLSLSEMGNEELKRIAVVTDIRGGDMFKQIPEVLKKLREKNVDYKILFLDATDEELVRRYRANRRKHPLCIDETVSLEDAVSIERAKLATIREMSDFVIDTSELTTYALKSRVSETLFGNSREGFTVVCKSFGFKHGIDTEADLMFDVRCLPNPFYVEDLKKKNGLQKEVTDYIFSFKETKKFAKELLEFIKCALPLYVKEGKSQLVISMGCTGGKHRSVAFAELIYRELIEEGYNAKTLHRDIEK